MNFSDNNATAGNSNPYQFLSGKGEMARLTRNFDWSTSPMGGIENWPQSLRTTLSIMLNSKFPMLLMWGDELITFYNDALRPSYGENGMHPQALGMPAEKIWKEMWPIISDDIRSVKNGGEATWKENQKTPVYRNGQVEFAFWTYSYTPVIDESGKVGGVLSVVTETTENVKLLEELQLSNERFDNLVSEATLGIVALTGKDMRVQIINESYARLIMRTAAEMKGKLLFDLIPEAEAVFRPLLEKVLQTGESIFLYDYPSHVIVNNVRKDSYLNVTYQPYKNNGGDIIGVMVLCYDVTEQVLAKQEAQEQRSYLQNAIDIANVGTYKMDIANNTTTFSENIKELFEADDIVKPTSDLLAMVHPDDVARIQQVIGESFSSEEKSVHHSYYRMMSSKDGSIRHVHSVGQSVMKDGKPDSISGIIQDVTDQVIAQKKLEESELNLRNIFEQAPVGMVLLMGPTFIIEIVNSRCLQRWGRTQEEVIGKPLFTAFPDETHNEYKRLISEVYTDGKTYSAYGMPVTLERNGGVDTHYISFTYEPFHDFEGNIVGVMEASNDVTEEILARQKVEETEAQVRNTAERLQIAIDAGNLGSYELMFSDNILHCNATCRNHFNFSPDEIVTYDKVVEKILPEDRETKNSTFKQAVDVNDIYDVEYRVKWADASLHWIRVVGKTLYDEQKKPWKMVGITLDITEQKMFAETLSAQVKERTVELQRSNDDLLQFAHVASHDLKEPVRKIKLYSGRMQKEFSDILPDEGNTYLKKVQSATDRMLSMIEGVLAYSSINSIDQPIDKIDLYQIISEIESDLEVIITRKEATINIGTLSEIEGARILIYQLFYNIINNSLKFSKIDLPLVIDINSFVLDLNGVAFTKITVRDNGIGFEKQFDEKIFTTFTRLNSKDKYEGTGLGLALCKKIVERHSGKVFAEGRHNEGATITILLPLKQYQSSI